MEFKDVKIFVPAKDFKLSLCFYKLLGWKENWVKEDELAELELANQRFLLQNFYVKKWACNFMIYIDKTDVHAFYNEILEKLNLSKFSKTKITAPKKEEHAIVCYIWDPSGVLLHFAESY